MSTFADLIINFRIDGKMRINQNAMAMQRVFFAFFKSKSVV